MSTIELDWLTHGPIAHRGLHDLTLGRAENSMGAFRAAIEHGYAIECDVQVSKTGEAVVFHDSTLDRMTTINGNVRDFTYEALQNITLLDTQDGIYTLAHHMEIVAGRVPVIVELKGVEGQDAGLVESVAETLNTYEGQVAVMSFDHWLCAQFATLMPAIPRGLTAEGEADTSAIHEAAMEEYDLQFVSYDVNKLHLPFPQSIRKAGMPLISWTVQDEAQAHHSLKHGAQITFEGFLPHKDQRP